MGNLPLPNNVSSGLMNSALSAAQQLKNNGTGINSNLQNLFDNIKAPDFTMPNLPDYSKMQQQKVNWVQPKYNTDGSVTQSQNTQQIADPNTFAFQNMLAGKGSGQWLPTMQRQQFQEDQVQNYLKNLQGATQMNQNQDQWQREYDYRSGQDAIKNSMDWARISGYMPDGSDTESGKQTNSNINHTMFGDMLAGDAAYSNIPSGNSGSSGTSTAPSAIDSLLKMTEAQNKIDELGRQMAYTPDYQKAQVIAQIDAIRKEAGL
jgi:hypothetical protein